MAYKLITLRQYKKMNKDEGYNTFLQELPDLVKYYFRNLIVGKEELAVLHERMASLKHYARYVKHACKTEERNPFPDGFSFILIEFIQKFSEKAENVDEDDDLQKVLDIYSKALEKMCKKTAKNISKELDIPKSIAIDLAVIYPGDALNKHNAWVFNRELVRRLFQLQKFCCVTETAEASKTADGKKSEIKSVDSRYEAFDFANKKLIKKLFKGFFGKDEEILERVYSNLALEKVAITKHYTESQKKLWDTISEWLVEAIEKLPIKSVKRILDFYIQKRNRDNDTDSKRRLTLSEIKYDDAPKIVTLSNPDKYSVKALEKAEKKGKKKDKKKKKKKDK